jgi:hypothetical protein
MYHTSDYLFLTLYYFFSLIYFIIVIFFSCESRLITPLLYTLFLRSPLSRKNKKKERGVVEVKKKKMNSITLLVELHNLWN